MKDFKMNLQMFAEEGPKGSKKAYRINVENLVYAIVESDTAQETVYGKPKKLSEAMQIQLTPTVASASLYGDGVKQSVISKLTGLTAVIDATKIHIEDRALILGQTYENGKLWESGKDVPKYCAIGYKVPHDEEGVAEYIWLLKGKAQPYASTVTQATDSINFSTDSITVDFVARESDSMLKVSMDSASDQYNEEVGKTWFDKVPVQ